MPANILWVFISVDFFYLCRLKASDAREITRSLRSLFSQRNSKKKRMREDILKLFMKDKHSL